VGTQRRFLPALAN
jgi:hypothetical protein